MAADTGAMFTPGQEEQAIRDAVRRVERPPDLHGGQPQGGALRHQRPEGAHHRYGVGTVGDGRGPHHGRRTRRARTPVGLYGQDRYAWLVVDPPTQLEPRVISATFA